MQVTPAPAARPQPKPRHGLYAIELRAPEFRLDDAFLQDFANREVKWGPVGYVVYKRTYARFQDPDQPGGAHRTVPPGESEDWWQTVARVVEGCYQIQQRHCQLTHVYWNERKAQQSAQRMYELIFDFKFTPPGRGLWMMGTPYIRDHGSAALNNCAFVSTEHIDIDFSEPFIFLMDMSMLGVGVGSDTRGADSIDIVKPARAEFTLAIPDTREGWIDATRTVLEAYVGNGAIPEFDYSAIRPAGEPIRGFGGTAAGPEPLRKLLEQDLPTILDPLAGQSITSAAIVDIHNVIGKCVVSGNVRRSAEIMFGEPDDLDFLKLKDPEVAGERMVGENSWRWASNNSIFASVGMDYATAAGFTAKAGEPGYLWLDNIRDYGRMVDGPNYKDQRAMGANPCVEQTLESYELCCLVETYPAHHETFEEYEETLKYAYLYAKTVTLLPTHNQRTNRVMMRNRRIGLSQSGIIQNVAKHGWREHFTWCDRGYAAVQSWDTVYSEWFCVPPSIKTTSVKPSGCRPAEALTATSEGLLTLEEVFELSGHQVGEDWHEMDTPLAALGAGPISKTYDNGEQDILRIRLSYGIELESTPNHQWFVKSRYDRNKKDRYVEVNEWRRADELQLDDILDVNLQAYRREHAAPLAQVNPLHLHMRSDARRIRQPVELTPDLAWLLGYLWGDGCQSPEKFRIRFTDANLDNLQKAQRVFLEQFDVPSNIHPASEGRRASVLEVGSKHLWHWFIRNDVWKYFNSGLSDIPRIVRASGHEQVIAFMAGWLDSDGCVSATSRGHKVIWTTNDTAFARHAQDVLWAVGFGVGRSLNDQNEQRLSAWGTYLMTLGAHVDPDAFTLLTKHSVKAAKVEATDWHWQQAKPRMIVGKVTGVEEAGRKPTFDFEVPSEHWYWAGAVRSHNTVSKLCGATAGIHYPIAEHYILRIRFANTSPMLADLAAAGYHVEDCAYNPATTKVVEFPVKEPYFYKAEADVSMWEQLTAAAGMQKWWSDNQVSCTVKFDMATEGPQIEAALALLDDQLKGISFLPHAHGYVQAPQEPIDEAEYNRRAAALRGVTFGGETAEAVDKFCDGGVCELPVKS